ncbi:hypothetical protein [Orenia marismortui]|uniref:hypothetical protein n=1 Tax=Orenia marismortui TaxID=46469 RepID=UPI00037F0789|nr:hypothetical protein [Orenia marismortui]
MSIKELNKEELANDLLCNLMIVDLEMQKEDIDLEIIKNKVTKSISNCKSIIGLSVDVEEVARRR